MIADEVFPGATFNVIGEAAAGHAFDGAVSAGQCVRIFTGAPVPEGASRVVIQEDVTREGDRITLSDNLDKGFHIRPAGADFTDGQEFTAPRILAPFRHCPVGGDEHCRGPGDPPPPRRDPVDR